MGDKITKKGVEATIGKIFKNEETGEQAVDIDPRAMEYLEGLKNFKHRTLNGILYGIEQQGKDYWRGRVPKRSMRNKDGQMIFGWR